MMAIIWLPIIATGLWALIRVGGLERGTPCVQLIAFTPYMAMISTVPLAIALGTRHWIAAGVAALVTLTLAACVLPRSIASGSYGASAEGRPTLRVLTSNLLFGMADAQVLVDLIRRKKVDVLAVQELTREVQGDLTAAGLDSVLPYRATVPLPGASGTGIFSRMEIIRSKQKPLTALDFVQTAATIAIPGSREIDIESTHPSAPAPPGMTQGWQADMRLQTPATPRGTPRILMGDFNSTLDHALLRRLISTGYRDAATVAGKGLTPTWPRDGQRIPGVALDHVLADKRIGVRNVSFHDIPGTDHRAVFAELILPR